MVIVIDGNDGAGKTTLVERLRQSKCQYDVQDRGLPSKATDDISLVKFQPQYLYFILLADPAILQNRLKLAGKDITEQYHTIDDLKYYHSKFLEVAELLPYSHIINADDTEDNVFLKVVTIIHKTQELWSMNDKIF